MAAEQTPMDKPISPPRLEGPTENPPQIAGPTPDQPLLTGPRGDQSRIYAAPEHEADKKTGDKKTDDKQPEGKPTEEPPEDKEHKGRIWRLALILAVIFGVLLLIALLPRLGRNKQVKADAKNQTQADAQPTINTVSVQQPPAYDDLTLPGNIQAVQQTAIVARASGYVKHYFVDIGDKVRAGQLLATIATPDLDQQVTQARAQVSQAQAAVSQSQANLGQQQANVAQGTANLSRAQAQFEQARTDLARARAALAQAQEASAQQSAQVTQAQANLNLARVTAQRYQNLLAEGAIDQQTTDQAVASEQTNAANVQALTSALRASEANVRAYRAAVGSSQANVSAYVAGVQAGRAAVGAALANVRSARAAITASQENVRSAQANVARFTALQGFQNVTAPFAGVVTARNVDTGALIGSSGSPSGAGDTSSVGSGAAGTTASGNAAGGSAVGGSSPGGSSGSTGTSSLFSLAQLGTLRLYLNVPQTYLGVVGVGQQADVEVREMAGRKFKGIVTRSAGAFDAASRTVVTEVHLANPNGALKPGMFAEVHLRVPHPGGAVTIPGTALVTNAGGTQVVLVGQDDKIHFQPITVGRDFGQTIEVTQGLRAGQQIASTPSDSLHEGLKVKAVKAKPPTGKT